MKFKDLLNPRDDKYWLSKPYMLAEIEIMRVICNWLVN